jgi:hypothetical protein
MKRGFTGLLLVTVLLVPVMVACSSGATGAKVDAPLNEKIKQRKADKG